MAAGYDINSIRAGLINYGYNAADVEEAIRALKPAAPKIPIIPIAIGAAVLLIVVIGLFLIFGGEKPEKQLLDLKTSATVSTVAPGDSLSFNVELINMGAIKRYDVSLLHQIFDSAGREITSKQEAMAIETRASAINSINIPANIDAGRYRLKTTAYYDTKTAESFFMFDVEEAEEVEVIELECPASCDDFDDCTEDYCSAETGYVCVHDPIYPCCGNGICESGEDYTNCPADCKAVEVVVPEEEPGVTLGEVKSTVKDLAAANPSQAVSYCNGLQKESYRDACFNGIAEVTQQSSYCESIVSETKKDNCYTNFALKGDYTVCDKIVNKYLRESCISLSQIPG